MKNYKIRLSIILLTLFFQVPCKSQINKIISSETVDSYPEEIAFDAPGQNPEGIEFNPKTNTFYLSAINKTPTIIAVGFDGSAKRFSNDNEAPSYASFGLEVDLKSNRLLACSNGQKTGCVSIYNLKNGDLEHTINLSSLLPEKNNYQINDLVLDTENNIYVSGRLEDVIYKIDSHLKPSVFYHKEGLTKPNGIIYHPNGYLLVSYSHQNYSLVKIPISTPEAAEIITIKDFDFKGFDGMILNEKGNLVAVSFNSNAKGENLVLELSTTDNWKTAKVVNSKITKKSTTITQVKPNLYYVLNQDWKNRDAEKWILEKVAF